MNIDDIWKKHLYIEYRLGKIKNGDSILINESAWENKLWEEHGIMPNMDSYADTVCNYVENYLNTNSYGQHSFIANANIFDFPTFFDECAISFKINYDKNITNTKYGGGYTSGMSGWKGDTNGQEYYYIQISVYVESGDINDILYCVRHTIVHEMTHAYDDYGRGRTRKVGDEYKTSGDSLFISSTKRGQYKAQELIDNPDTYISAMGGMIYHTSNTEINASIAAFKTELLQRMIGTNNSESAMDAIKETKLYSIMNRTNENLHALLVIKNNTKIFGEIQKIMLDAFNEMRHHDGWAQLIGITKSLKFSNFDQLYKYLQKRVWRYNKRIITQTSKIAYDVYCQVGDRGTDNKILNR